MDIKKIEDEARKNIKKPKKKKTTARNRRARQAGNSCSVVRFMGNNNILLWLDPSDPASLSPLVSTMPDRLTQLTSAGYPGIMESNIAIAKYGEKVWIHGEDAGQPGNPKVIIEWNLDVTALSLLFSNVYYELPAAGNPNLGNSVIGAGMCAIDANTLVVAKGKIGRINLNSSNSTYTVDPNTINITGGVCQGDVVYLPSSNSTITAIFSNSGVPHFWQHHDPNGNLLHQLNYPSNSDFVVSMFCHNGKVIAPSGVGPTGVMREIQVDPFTGVLSTVNSGLSFKNAEDMASDPQCCDNNNPPPPPPPPPPQPTHCPYNIGDIGPGGGIIFALPNTGINNTSFAYEISADAIQLATTPMSALPSECRNQKPLIVKVRQLSASFGSIPNTALRFEYGPGSQNPNFFPSDINVGDILDAFSTTGGNLFPAGSVPQVTLVTLIPPSPPLFTTTHCRIDFSVAMIGPPASQPAASATFYVTPSNIPNTGAEWGGYDRPIVTSEAFGQGKKNTDIISLVTQTNNPPSHPTVPSHDIAANLCLAFSQNNLDDWFLPSYEELEEAFNLLGSNGLNMLPNPPGINNEKTVYWSSSALNPVNNLLSPTSNSNEFAWSYITPFNTTFLYRKCKTLSVLPVRRFECIDKGIKYDYRLAVSTFGGGSFTNNSSTGVPLSGKALPPGVMGFLGFTENPLIGQTITTTETVRMIMTGYQGWPSGTTFPNGIGPGVIMVEFNPGATISVGQVLDPPLAFWGPVMFVYTVNTPSGSAIRAVFGNYGGGSSVSTSFGQNTFQSITWTNSSFITNPSYSPSVFGNSNREIGKDKLTISCSGWDIRLNNVKREFTNSMAPGWISDSEKPGVLFNIKVYNQFEELLGDWDYKMFPWSHPCGATTCAWYFKGDLVNTNYVNPAYAHPVHTSVVDLTHLFNRPSGNIVMPIFSAGNLLSSTHDTGTHDEGSGYVSMEILDTQYVSQNFPGNVHIYHYPNQNPRPSYNGRGNTLNLMNWLGVGNRRVTDPNNLPPEWSTLYNRFPWGVVCMPCGWQNGCTNHYHREWMAELDFTSSMWFVPPGNLYASPTFTNGLDMSSCSGTNFHVSHINGGSWGAPYIGATALTSYPNQVSSAWQNLLMGHACNIGTWQSTPTDCSVIAINGQNDIHYTLINGVSSSLTISTASDRQNQYQNAGFTGISEGFGQNIAIARFGEVGNNAKVFIYGTDTSSPGSPFVIIEFDLTSFPSLVLSNVYYGSGYISSGNTSYGADLFGAGMCSMPYAFGYKLVLAGSRIGRVFLNPNPSSGSGGVGTPTFYTISNTLLTAPCQGDVIYIPTTDTTITSIENTSGPNVFQHHDHNGTLLDELNYPVDYDSVTSMFCYDSEIIAPAKNTNNSNTTMLKIEVDTTNNTLSYGITILPYMSGVDMSSNPECCTGFSAAFKLIDITTENHVDDELAEGCFETGDEKYELYIQKPNSDFNGELSSARKRHSYKNKKLKETGPFGIMGYYPLYDTIQGAQFASPTMLKSRKNENTYGYHIHVFEGIEYYMPNGLQMGVTQFHGDYDGRIIEQAQVEDIIIEPTIQAETTEQIPPPIITPPEEDEEPPTTYTPPPSRPSGSGGY